MITLVRAFPDICDLYGDYANVSVLARRLLDAKIEVRVVDVRMGEDWQDLKPNFISFGATVEQRLPLLVDQLTAIRPALEETRHRGGLILATGSSASWFGTPVDDPNSRGVLGMSDQTFLDTNTRYYGDCIAHTPLVSAEVIGSINTSLQISTSAYPLLEIQKCSNPDIPKHEGFGADGLLTTSLSGPLLVANPDLLDAICAKLVGEPLPKINSMWLGYALGAYQTALSDLQATLK